MKSYKDSISGIKNEIATLNKQLEIIRKYPPTKLYLLYGVTILFPRQYVLCLERWRNKIIFNVIASDDWDVPCTHTMLLGQFMGTSRTKLVPINIKDLSLYIHLKNKTPVFEKIIKTGKLLRR
jgi:hypothetical protein